MAPLHARPPDRPDEPCLFKLGQHGAATHRPSVVSTRRVALPRRVSVAAPERPASPPAARPLLAPCRRGRTLGGRAAARMPPGVRASRQVAAAANRHEVLSQIGGLFASIAAPRSTGPRQMAHGTKTTPLPERTSVVRQAVPRDTCWHARGRRAGASAFEHVAYPQIGAAANGRPRSRAQPLGRLCAPSARARRPVRRTVGAPRRHSRTGESLERALTRELQEEAGLAPLRPPTLISTAHRRSPRGTLLHEHTFQVETADPDPLARARCFLPVANRRAGARRTNRVGRRAPRLRRSGVARC